MGADLLLVTVELPDGLMRDIHARWLELVDALPDEDLLRTSEDALGIYEDDEGFNLEEVRRQLRLAVNYATGGESLPRDIEMLQFPGSQPRLISGGMSWGDDPCDGFFYLNLLATAGWPQ